MNGNLLIKVIRIIITPSIFIIFLLIITTIMLSNQHKEQKRFYHTKLEETNFWLSPTMIVTRLILFSAIFNANLIAKDL
jgi:hypothetical protein